jgi:hypothetical protein
MHCFRYRSIGHNRAERLHGRWMQIMSLSNRWKSLSRLNRTRILVAVYLVAFVAALGAVPLVMFQA